MQIPLILTLEVSIMLSEIFGLIEQPNNNVSINKMEQEEQEDEYINAVDILNNFQCLKICYLKRSILFYIVMKTA